MGALDMLPTDEMAAVLGISVTAFRTRASRAKVLPAHVPHKGVRLWYVSDLPRLKARTYARRVPRKGE